MHPQQAPAARSPPGALAACRACDRGCSLALAGPRARRPRSRRARALALVYLRSRWLLAVVRRVVVVDMLAIAAGFVLRALAGGVATDIYLSRYFVLVTGFGALFLVGAKRYAELREQPATARRGRRCAATRARSLRLSLAMAAAGAGRGLHRVGVHAAVPRAWYALSVVPFLLWLARYAALIGAGAGQAPEELILRDRMLLALSVRWGLLFLGGVYVGH